MTTTSTSPTTGRWLLTSSLASLASMLVLAWQGRRRHGNSAALINAPSHWVHGDKALRANTPSLRFTLVGAAIHHASSLFWAMIYEGILRGLAAKPDVATSSATDSAAPTPSRLSLVTAASALTTAAWLIDTRLVPSRLTPGFERRSSRAGMAFTYGAFAAGLAVGALAVRERRARLAPNKAAPQPKQA